MKQEDFYEEEVREFRFPHSRGDLVLEPMEEGQFWIDQGEEGQDSQKDIWRRENIDERALDNFLRG
jgi:hypothetical protein